MKSNQFLLLKDRRFAPLFVTQFLGAFHDNLFKNALVVLLLYDVSTSSASDPKLLTTMAAGLFILPFVLFSAMGGQLADKFPKDRVIRVIKIFEIFIALLGACALFSGVVWFSFVVLFALGTQSAFFGPSKYSILPQHVQKEELIGGNALLNTGTFLAILVGTIIGTVVITIGGGKLYISLLMLLSAVIGYLVSRLILPAPSKVPQIKINYNFASETFSILCYVFLQSKRVVLAVLGVAWFYFLGGMYLAQLPNFTKDSLLANEHVLAFFLVLFSVGVATGGLLNNKILKGEVKASFVPFALLGITLFSIDLFFATSSFQTHSQGLVNLGVFLETKGAWRIIFDMSIVAICGGLFVVPLNAIIQHYTKEDHRARVVAGSAIMNALFVFLSSVLSWFLISNGYKVEHLFFVFSICNLLPLIISFSFLRMKFDG